MNQKIRPIKGQVISLHECIETIITVLDARDPYTFAHSWRVAAISELLAESMNINREWIENIHIAAHLHDIGKVGVPDNILNKEGKLTLEEYEKMKEHAVIGYNIVKKISMWEGISRYVKYHHERYDGSGYPEGLKGKDIPLGARIIAVADTYDAITTKRSYKPALSHEDALEEIKWCSGFQLCPEVIEAFIKEHENIRNLLKDVQREIKHFQ